MLILKNRHLYKIEIHKVKPPDLEKLQNIGKLTFFETFADSNTQENMQKYLATSFNLDQLESDFYCNY